MSRIIRRRIFWNMAGSSGLIIGGILTLATVITYFLRDQKEVAGMVNNILVFAAFIIVPYFLGRRFSKKNALWGLTYQRALGYMIVMYLLSGFLLGISTYVIYNLDTQYYLSECHKSMELLNVNTQVMNDSIELMMASPLQLAFSFMLTLPFLALLPALIIAALIKRDPAIRDYK